MATAARENAMTTRKLSELDSELKRMLTDLRVQSKDDDSVHLANVVQRSLVGNLRSVNRYAVDLDVKRAFFYVLINTEMPSILAEVGFISNPDEEKLLQKDSYRQSIAEALYEGIKKYVDTRNPQTMGI
jgi:N-acetylmuramoyl-L-alanine amidase